MNSPIGFERAPSLARRISTIAALVVLLPQAASAATQFGYADLVRRVAPSVVTVLVEEQGQGAGQRAADRALAATDVDPDAAVRAIMRRLLAGPGSSPDN